MLLALLLTFAADSEPRVKPPIRIAVYQLELQDVTLAVGAVVSDSLLQEVRKLQGISAIGMTEIRDMLTHEAQKQLAGCSESGESCMAELAGALGVDELLTGKLAKAGGGSVMTLRRIDHKRASVTGVFDQRLELQNGSEYLAAVGPAVEKLFADFRLREGAKRGVSDEVALRLSPPPIPRVVTISVGAVAVATAIAGAIVGVMALTAQSDFTNYANLGVDSSIEGPLLNQKRTTLVDRSTAANVLYGTAGGLAVVTGVMAFFTDWKNYRADNAKLMTTVQ